MTQFNQYLLRNYNFSEWDSATAASVWQYTSVTATTISRLRETDAKNFPARSLFPQKGGPSGPYIFDGGSSHRATLTAAAAAADFIIRQPSASAVGVLVQPLDTFTISFAARCSVPGNLLRVRVIGLVTTTDTYFAEPLGNTASVATNYNQLGTSFTWNTSARDIDIPLRDLWEVFGITVRAPAGATSMAVRLGNGTAGAQVIDFGAVHFRELERKKVA